MPCKQEYEEDEFNDTMHCFQKIKKCKLSKLMCQGTEGICSKYEEVDQPKEPEKPEPAEKPKVEEKIEDGKTER